MKKIMIITEFVSMPGEKSNGRFLYIADLLSKEQLEVEILTTNYSHKDKKHRTFDKEKNKCDYKFTMLEEPGYKKNVSLKRLYSHYIFSKNLKKYLNNLKNKPDIIYCAVPPLGSAKEAAKYAHKNNIRFIIDIQDLWPEAFKMVFNLPIISNLIYFPMKKNADYIYSMADDILTVSETYLNRALEVNTKAINKQAIFLGTELDFFDKCKKGNYIKQTNDEIKLAYIGTLGHSYDITNVIDAMEILKNRGITNLKFLVMGDGPLKEQFETYAKEKNINCQFTGRLNYDEMVGCLCSCDIAVNPIKSNSAGSIINKVGDYAAAGLPVINTQECEEYKKLVEQYNIGYNCENNNPEELANKIEMLYNNEELRKEMGNNNRRLAEGKFDRKITYKKIIDLLKDKE